MTDPLFAALDVLCKDALDSTINEVRARDDDGEITVAMQRVIAAADALVYIGHFATDHAYMASARTLHYDMAGRANEALTGLLQSKMPPRSADATEALHD